MTTDLWQAPIPRTGSVGKIVGYAGYWWGGYSYSKPFGTDDGEYFRSIEAAREECNARRFSSRSTSVPLVYDEHGNLTGTLGAAEHSQTPVVGSESVTELYPIIVQPDGTLAQTSEPAVRITFGRGSARVERF